MKFRRKKGKTKVRARRRRANPTMPVILANPRRRRRVRRKRRSNGRKMRQIGFKFPRRHTRWAGVKSHTRRTNPTRRRRYRRRSNPGFSLSAISSRSFRMGQIVGIGIAGMAGIVTARIVSSFYTRNVQQYVLGAEGAANPASWRAILDDVVRIVVMEMGVMLGEKVLRSAKVPSEYAQAYFYGGTAEVGRVAVGTAVRRMAPSTDRARWGLDGPRASSGDGSEPAGYFNEDTGELVIRNASTGQYELAGVMTEEEFSMAGVMTEDEFAEAGY
jgi:hypothetical protein